MLFSFSFNFNLVSSSLQPASFPITTSSTSWVLPWWLYLWDKLSVRHKMFSNFSVSATGVKWAEWKIKSKTDDVAVGTGRWKRKTDVRFDLTVLLKYDKTHELKVNPSFVIHVLTLIRFELVAVCACFSKDDRNLRPVEKCFTFSWNSIWLNIHMKKWASVPGLQIPSKHTWSTDDPDSSYYCHQCVSLLLYTAFIWLTPYRVVKWLWMQDRLL